MVLTHFAFESIVLRYSVQSDKWSVADNLQDVLIYYGIACAVNVFFVISFIYMLHFYNILNHVLVYYLLRRHGL